MKLFGMNIKKSKKAHLPKIVPDEVKIAKKDYFKQLLKAAPPQPIIKAHPFLDAVEVPERLREFNPVNYGTTWFGKKQNEWKTNRNPGRVVLINMEMINGKHGLYLAVEKDGGFKYRKKKYLLDNDSKYEIITQGDGKNSLWGYDFHERFALPIKRKIPVEELRESIEFNTNKDGVLEKADTADIAYATNPVTLEQFEVAKIAEGIMAAGGIAKWMRIIMVIVVIILVVLILFMIMFMFKSGMFQAAKNLIPTSTTFAGVH